MNAQNNQFTQPMETWISAN